MKVGPKCSKKQKFLCAQVYTKFNDIEGSIELEKLFSINYHLSLNCTCAT
jgi:hypothetical protein